MFKQTELQRLQLHTHTHTHTHIQRSRNVKEKAPSLPETVGVEAQVGVNNLLTELLRSFAPTRHRTRDLLITSTMNYCICITSRTNAVGKQF